MVAKAIAGAIVLVIGIIFVVGIAIKAMKK